MHISEDWLRSKLEQLGDVDEPCCIGPLFIEDKAQKLIQEQSKPKWQIEAEKNGWVPHPLSAEEELSIALSDKIVEEIDKELTQEEFDKLHPSAWPDGPGGRYDPFSRFEDFYFLNPGKGSLVETLPGGVNLGEISDLEYFKRNVLRGLRVPEQHLRRVFKVDVGDMPKEQVDIFLECIKKNVEERKLT
jgi:hypothetical protein